MKCQTYIGLAAAAVLCWSSTALAARGSGDKLDRRHHRPHNGRGLGQLGRRQSGGACGADAGRCPGDLCCSDYGFCGDSVDHCAPLFGCQAQYGTCGWPRVAPQPTTSAPPPPPSTTSTTSTSIYTPPTTSSTSTSIYTPPPPSTTSTSTPPPPTSTSRPVVPPSSSATTALPPVQTGGLQITTNGQCGNGTMCIGNPNYGPCCSQFFWCGSSLDFCGAGCKSDFGACLGVPGLPGGPASNVTSSSAPVVIPPTSTTTSTTTVRITSTTSTTPTTTSTSTTPTSTSTSTTPLPPTTTSSTRAPTPTVTIPAGQRTTTDGRCGNGVNCLGANFGRCCSQFGFCGDGDQYCPYIVGCQSEFGYCDPAP
ncbi:hypothetical protein B0H63DRAFT_485467 [Podospora didyma]|uniref:Chitin-binding type-1 domain-containing protein n=1 Tax=Podospora didyma TaxID=330526 RepID=A0AAE0N747_9PEZI|nr:hypothetical protein B0H63DRAFT_485467 [Podospora didyma]